MSKFWSFLKSSHAGSVLKGAAIAGIGAALTSFADHMGDLNLSASVTPIVAASLSIGINALRKYAAHSSEQAQG